MLDSKMKSTLLIALGFVLGVVVTFGSLFFCARCFHHCSSTVDGPSPTDIRWLDKMTLPKQESLELAENQVLLITTKDGIAAIHFSDFGDMDGVSTYEWRFQPTDGSSEAEGSGQVFEKYEATEKEPDHYELKDIGSKLQVVAGPIQVGWSYSSPNTGWIYYDPEHCNTKIISETALGDINLKERPSNQVLQRTPLRGAAEP